MFCIRFTRILALFCTLLIANPIYAQLSRGSSVSGQIMSSDGRPITQAVVTLSGPDGFRRIVSTSLDGTFTILDLPSGTYSLHAAAVGFRTSVQPVVSVAIGRMTQVTLTLAVAGSIETASVNAETPSFDTTQTSSVVNIDRDRVEELPIPNRNYLTFVALSPQATPANPVLAQHTLTQSSGGFGFGGLRPGSNSIRLDGVGDDDEFSGSGRTQLSPEAINDFQIVNHGFAAESGEAAGGSIDVQTRAGLNRPHGDAFLFVQNGALNGTPPLGLNPYKPDESRLRAGVALGGALQPDKTFYYIAAEQELARGEDTNDLKPSTISEINQAIARFGAMQGIQLQAGFFPTTDQETELSGRIDRALSPKQAAMLRYAFTNTRNVADAFNTDELADRSARGSSFTSDNSLNGTLTSTLANGLLNKFSLELSQRRAVERTSTVVGPGALIPGIALFGTPYAGNNRRFETHFEVEQGALLARKHHLFQAGAGVDRVAVRAQVLDGSHGLFVFPTLAAFTNGSADFYIQSFFKDSNTNFTEYRSKAYLQDHWTPARTLAVDFGLRYEDNHLPSPLPQHALNFSPRIGLAFTPVPSLVLRSGFGLFYDRYLLSTLNRLLQFDGVHGFSQILEDSEALAIYRSGSIPTTPRPDIAPSIWQAQRGLHNPYSEVASFSAEQALPLQTTLKVEYQYVHGIHLGRTTNINLLPPVVLTMQNAASLNVSFPTAQQLGRLVFSPVRQNPAYDAVNESSSSANSTYNGVTVTLNRQFTDEFQLLAGYTYSKTLDDASFDFEQPQNPYVLKDERALSLQDQRHRLTLSGLYLIGPDLNDPQDSAANANPGPLMRLLTGLEFAPIFSVSSGFRANPITGVDSGRNHIYPFSSRPLGSARNSLSAAPNINFDLRLLKIISLGPGHLDVVAESFNLLNHRNVSLLSTAFGSDISPQSSFGRPIGTATARRIQFSLDYEF